MKKLLLSIFAIAAITATLLLFTGCGKGGSTPEPTSPVVVAKITSLSPTSGTPGASVIITGTGFSTSMASNKVLFNGKEATVSAATTTSLTVTVPADAGTGAVTISVNGAAVITGPVFTYVEQVKITSIDKSEGKFDDVVLITGNGFSTVLTDDKVFFNGKVAIVIAATATQLNVKVPLGAGAGKITLSVSGAEAVIGPMFTYKLSYVVSTFAVVSTSTSLYGITNDNMGNIYVADKNSNYIRKFTPDGIGSIIAGNGSSGKTNGSATMASFSSPNGVVVDSFGNVYVADSFNNLVRKITSSGEVTTFAGGGGNAGNINGTGTAAFFFFPTGLTIDKENNVYVSENAGVRIRKITPLAEVSTYAGTGEVGTNDGDKSFAKFSSPKGITLDGNNNMYIVDGSRYIRKISASGDVTTIAGSSTRGLKNGPALTAQFDSPNDIGVDLNGDIFVLDYGNLVIRKISAGVVSTFAGNGARQSVDGPAPAAGFSGLSGITIDANGTMYVTDGNQIRKIALQ
jgi:hypothetical protein